MKPSVFVDTSGLFALLVPEDEVHAQAVAALQRLRQTGVRALTTDYILDEAATLLMTRKKHHLAARLFQFMQNTQACEIVSVWPEHFLAAAEMFQRYGTKFSFTDCTSFVVMQERGLQDALSKDADFRVAGFHPLLA